MRKLKFLCGYLYDRKFERGDHQIEISLRQCQIISLSFSLPPPCTKSLFTIVIFFNYIRFRLWLFFVIAGNSTRNAIIFVFDIGSGHITNLDFILKILRCFGALPIFRSPLIGRSGKEDGEQQPLGLLLRTSLSLSFSSRCMLVIFSS